MKYTKVCSKCKLQKDINNFYNDISKVDGKQTKCKACFKVYQIENKDKRNAYATPYSRKLHRSNKIKAIEYKGGMCIKCNSIVHEAAFDFHHRNTNTKDSSVGLLFKGSWEKIKLELDKCDLICSNCHRVLHYENGGNQNALYE